MDNGYTISDIYKAALNEWHLRVNDAGVETNYKKQIRRKLDEWLTQAGYQHQDLTKQGREYLYPISSPERFVTSRLMYAYFNAYSSVDMPRPITITDQEVKRIQGNEEDLWLAKPNEPTDEFSTVTEEIREQNYIDHEFEKRKYKVMLEALFNETFKLNERKLKQDLRDLHAFDEHFSLEETTKEVETIRERLKHSKQYYFKKN